MRTEEYFVIYRFYPINGLNFDYWHYYNRYRREESKPVGITAFLKIEI